MTFNEYLQKHYMRRKNGQRMLSYEIVEKTGISYTDLTDATHGNKLTDSTLRALTNIFNKPQEYWKDVFKRCEPVEQMAIPVHVGKRIDL